jgi:hypothetical protein
MKPIAFFAYKRPTHTSQSLGSLARNEGAEESTLFIFCDGPKGPEDEEAVRQTREVVRSKQWCGTVYVIERENNLGCANSIISGVTSVCDEYGCVIVLEDDLDLSPFFLDYMKRALDLYRDDDRVMQISGHMFPVELHETTDAIFLPFTTTIGWATWQLAWRHFDPYMSGYEKLRKDKRLRYKFNLSGAYPYYEMVESQMNGQIDSWGIRWYLSTFLFGGLTLHPTHSLVRHMGFDEYGTHCGSDVGVYSTEISEERVTSFPKSVEENQRATQAIIAYFKRHQNHSACFLDSFRKLFSRLR